MTAPYALALLALNGVGRVTAHRILERFPTLDALRATPREQVLLRLKGAPNAEATVDALLAPEAMAPHLDRAHREVEAITSTGVHILTLGTATWPAGLDRLPRSERPVALYAYGHVDRLERPAVSILARAPIEAAPFEAVQAVARRLAAAGTPLVMGMGHGVDVAVQKVALAGAPPIAVVGCGLGRMERSLRPAATALVRAGGLLLSPFAMGHGPFDHDDRERALVQAALGEAVCVVAPPADSSEDRAAAWAFEAGLPVALVPPAPPGAPYAADALPADALTAPPG
ncbi:MAG: DNA-processing protein DprA [Bacteroidota bacterium]